MTKKPLTDGGPAFPVREADRFNPENNETHTVEQHWGMTLREWFAGQAIQGLMASKTFGLGEVVDVTQAAFHAYRAADALLAEREKGVATATPDGVDKP